MEDLNTFSLGQIGPGKRWPLLNWHVQPLSFCRHAISKYFWPVRLALCYNFHHIDGIPTHTTSSCSSNICPSIPFERNFLQTLLHFLRFIELFHHYFEPSLFEILNLNNHFWWEHSGHMAINLIRNTICMDFQAEMEGSQITNFFTF